jgi:hypothetical protein
MMRRAYRLQISGVMQLRSWLQKHERRNTCAMTLDAAPTVGRKRPNGLRRVVSFASIFVVCGLMIEIVRDRRTNCRAKHIAKPTRDGIPITRKSDALGDETTKAPPFDGAFFQHRTVTCHRHSVRRPLSRS